MFSKQISLEKIKLVTVQLVFKDDPWEENNLVFLHRWYLITGYFMQKMSNWDIKGVVTVDRETSLAQV